MKPFTKSPSREIIDDFAEEIVKRATKDAKPSKIVINFRNEVQDRREREIISVPIELLRYRKDNGRITSDVLQFETTKGPLSERDQSAQDVIHDFLVNKDPTTTEQLKNSILHTNGPLEPAIITCDGFLINGNRRRMAMKELQKLHPNVQFLKFMKVVMLPGKNDEGGPPTLFEIEKIENRYQLQRDGRAEYYGFDRALTIRRKLEMGLSLEEQLRDDPEHVGADDKQIKRAEREVYKDYLNPLKCADRFLSQFGREGQYHMISSGMGDREGRWQSFLD